VETGTFRRRSNDAPVWKLETFRAGERDVQVVQRNPSSSIRASITALD
jgi:hypothetical protein